MKKPFFVLIIILILFVFPNVYAEGIKAELDRDFVYFDSPVTITGSVEKIIPETRMIVKIEQSDDGRMIEQDAIIINSDKTFSFTTSPFHNWKSGMTSPPWHIKFNLMYGEYDRTLSLEFDADKYGQISLQATPDKESYKEDDTIIISSFFSGLYQNVTAGIAINKDGKDIIFQDNIELTPKIIHQLKIPIDERFEDGRYEIWITINKEQVNEITGKYHKNYFFSSVFFVGDVYSSSPIGSPTNSQNGMQYEYRGLDPTGEPLWIETDANYFGRIIIPLIFNIIVIGAIIGIIVLVIYKVNKNRKINKRKNIQINKEQIHHEKIQYQNKVKQDDEIKKLKEKVEELEKDKEKKD